MRATTLAISACVLGLGLLAGCGDDEPGTTPDPTPTASQSESPTPSSTPSPTQSESPSPTDPAGLVIEATIRGDDLEPNGERVKAKVGEEITINIDSDRAGELHVHSAPEQTLPFPKGLTTLTITIDRPGVVDVEEHEADKVLVSLQVS